ncbi:uncharacterized protein LOC110631069 [Manihot esculenta]|uniref:Uncharacterized protein n=1 Tax=Manihot esculenta TaxID=3983 RepID=A0ACB7GHU4_MANES|nr:uncharacterized protein LOC110631069 [Manihot esculenta]KAG8639359.1 hypothetical protein MANES_14G120700v8 [Manihot esculenta]
MLCNRSSSPLLILLVGFVFFLFLSTSSSATTLTSHLQTLNIPEAVSDESFNGVLIPLETRRHLEEENSNSTLILAAKRTRRKDPLDNLNRYTGGYNISNKHYWASVSLTAAPFFLIAGIWFVLFGLSLAFICLCYCCCRREPYGYSRMCYALSLIFLIFFTISAIVGCVVLYTGQQKFHSITTHTLDYVVNQANVTAENLRNVSDYLAAARSVSVDNMLLPGNIRNSISDIETKINSSSSTLSNRTQENSKDIEDGLDTMRLVLIILAAVMLALAFLGFLFSILGMQCLVYSLVILGWILVAGTFILCGVFLLVHNVVADTCVAMDEWVLHPTAKTAMDDIIPCVDNATAQATLRQTKEVTYQLVNVVDTIINSVSNRNFPPQAGPLYYNQSGPLMPVLCNPFNSDFTERQCVAGEVDFNNATEVWKNYICQDQSGICKTTGRITPSTYNQMATAVNLSYGLRRYGPFLVSLQDCTFVRQTLTVISHSYCPNLRRYTEWIYVGLVMVSAAVMLSLIFWVIYARERRHRVYTKQLLSRGMESRDKAP